ncbi:transketolase [Babesia caballi]|uniref:Transketolase n=1 Tax=Babesia caballi TaxID=5871 RepID=A0AAV4LVR1_BABCB|nr:transketolase [Babesia caballi]
MCHSGPQKLARNTYLYVPGVENVVERAAKGLYKVGERQLLAAVGILVATAFRNLQTIPRVTGTGGYFGAPALRILRVVIRWIELLISESQAVRKVAVIRRHPPMRDELEGAFVFERVEVAADDCAGLRKADVATVGMEIEVRVGNEQEVLAIGKRVSETAHLVDCVVTVKVGRLVIVEPVWGSYPRQHLAVFRPTNSLFERDALYVQNVKEVPLQEYATPLVRGLVLYGQPGVVMLPQHRLHIIPIGTGGAFLQTKNLRFYHENFPEDERLAVAAVEPLRSAVRKEPLNGLLSCHVTNIALQRKPCAFHRRGVEGHDSLLLPPIFWYVIHLAEVGFHGIPLELLVRHFCLHVPGFHALAWDVDGPAVHHTVRIVDPLHEEVLISPRALRLDVERHRAADHGLGPNLDVFDTEYIGVNLY